MEYMHIDPQFPMIYNNMMKKIDMQKYDEICQMLKKQHDNRINAISSFMQLSEKRRKIIENFNTDLNNSFNIFEDLSIDSKFNEINHSKMLTKILSSDTRDIGDKQHLRIFINLIEKIKGRRLVDRFDKDYKVIREEGRKKSIKESGGIDIFILDKKHSIIIENKITQRADDKDNQLARYYNISEEKGITPVAIVYMPFYHRYPPIESYTGKYRKLINTIRGLLVIIPALESGSGDDLTHGFLDECSRYAKSVGKTKTTASVCLDQYSRLIKSKGDVNQVATNENKKFITSVLSDKAMKKTIEDIAEMWGEREKIQGQIFLDHLIAKSGFKIVTGEYYGKMINKDIFVYFYEDPPQSGFGSIGGRLTAKMQVKLKKIVTSCKELTFAKSDASWVYGTINKDFLDGDPEAMKRAISSMVRKLEDEAKKILKSAAGKPHK